MKAFAEARPQVTIDDGLRSHVDDLIFNYDAFYDMARNSELSREDVEKLKIIYSAEKRRRVLGTHNGLLRKIKVYVPNHLDDLGDHPDFTDEYISYAASQTVNRTTVHEVGHYVDWQVNDGGRRGLGPIAQAVGGMTLAIGGNFVGHTPLNYLTIGTGVAITWQGVFKDRKYEERPGEIIASAFEDINSPKYEIVNLKVTT